MNAFAIVLLIIIGVLCVAGIFASAYRDNWLQFAGLSALALWSTADLSAAMQGGAVPPRLLLLYLGLAALLLGTAWKVLHHSTADAQPQAADAGSRP